MAVMNLLPKGVTYYKANLHCHTVHSDGKLTPQEVKKLYQERGYSIIAFTDHRHYANHSELNDEGFLAIAALETDLNEFGSYQGGFDRIKTYHINWFDRDPESYKEEKAHLAQPRRRYHDVEGLNEYVEKMTRLGFLACYNHPYWSLQTYEDYKDLRGFWGMEIYNHGCELDGLYGYHPQSYDEMLRSGQRLFALATDDNHNSFSTEEPLCDSFGSAVMIGAKELSYPAVMEALQKGHFYSTISPDGRSEGPRIEEISLEDGKLLVRCSPADKIFVKTMGRFCHRAAAMPGTTIDRAEFTLTGKEGYIRVCVQDAQGRHADSNAYFLDELLKK